MNDSPAPTDPAVPHPQYDALRSSWGITPEGHAAVDALHAELHAEEPDRARGRGARLALCAASRCSRRGSPTGGTIPTPSAGSKRSRTRACKRRRWRAGDGSAARHRRAGRDRARRRRRGLGREDAVGATCGAAGSNGGRCAADRAPLERQPQRLRAPLPAHRGAQAARQRRQRDRRQDRRARARARRRRARRARATPPPAPSSTRSAIRATRPSGATTRLPTRRAGGALGTTSPSTSTVTSAASARES